MVVVRADGYPFPVFLARQHQVYLVLFAVSPLVQHVAVGFHLLLLAHGPVEQVGEGVEPVEGRQALQGQQLVEVSPPDVARLMVQDECGLFFVRVSRDEDGTGERERHLIIRVVKCGSLVLSGLYGVAADVEQAGQLAGEIKQV